MTGPDRPRGQVRPRRVRASDPVARPVHGDGTATFEAHRPRLLRIAYRMLGSRSEAEDVVQDAWLRWVAADRTGVAAPDRFLARVVTRLCLDQIKSARAAESYVGPWLPEPLVEAAADGVDEDDLTLTLMLALERLSPLERAAFLLHDVFGLPLGDVAETLGRAPPAVRQLAARARRNVRAARPRYPVTRDEGERVARAFFEASASGDVARLRTLLADRVTLSSDGGGKVLAFINPIRGWSACSGSTRACGASGVTAGRRWSRSCGSTGFRAMSAASAAASCRRPPSRSRTAGSTPSTSRAIPTSSATSRAPSRPGRRAAARPRPERARLDDPPAARLAWRAAGPRVAAGGPTHAD